MRSLIVDPMNPRAAAIAAFVLVWAGALYCALYAYLSGRPEGLGIGLAWAFVTLAPWLGAFELAKRTIPSPGRSRVPNSWRIGAILLFAASASVVLQKWLFQDTDTAPDSLSVSLIRRTPAALVVLLLLFVPSLARRGKESQTRGTEGLPLGPRQIDWIKAAGNYLEINGGDHTTLCRMTMASAEDLLKEHGFLRVHRSVLINRHRVKNLQLGKIADEIVMEGGYRLKVGGAYRALIRRELGRSAD